MICEAIEGLARSHAVAVFAPLRYVGVGVLGLCGALLCARELEGQASGRGGRKGLIVLALALCAAAVLISQA